MERQAHGIETATVPPHGSIPPNSLVANLACDNTALPFPITPTPIPDVPTECFPHIAVFTGTAQVVSTSIHDNLQNGATNLDDPAIAALAMIVMQPLPDQLLSTSILYYI
jgi:hypothetical protein